MRNLSPCLVAATRPRSVKSLSKECKRGGEQRCAFCRWVADPLLLGGLVVTLLGECFLRLDARRSLYARYPDAVGCDGCAALSLRRCGCQSGPQFAVDETASCCGDSAADACRVGLALSRARSGCRRLAGSGHDRAEAGRTSAAPVATGAAVLRRGQPRDLTEHTGAPSTPGAASALLQTSNQYSVPS